MRVLCLNCYLIKSAKTLELFLRLLWEVILYWIYHDSDSILFLQNLRIWLVLPHNINTNTNKWLLKEGCQKQMWHIITKKTKQKLPSAEMCSNTLVTYFINNFPGWKIHSLRDFSGKERSLIDMGWCFRCLHSWKVTIADTITQHLHNVARKITLSTTVKMFTDRMIMRTDYNQFLHGSYTHYLCLLKGLSKVIFSSTVAFNNHGFWEAYATGPLFLKKRKEFIQVFLCTMSIYFQRYWKDYSL